MWFLLFLPLFTFSASVILVKTKQLMTTTYDPILLIVLRYLFVHLMYRITNIILGCSVSLHNKRTFLLTLVGGILLFGSYYLLVRASLLLPISIYSGILTLSPTCASILGIVLLSETLSYQQAMGSVIVLVGALTPMVGRMLKDRHKLVPDILLGVTLCITGVICSALFNVVLRFSSKYMVEKEHSDFGRQILQNTTLVAGVFGFIISLAAMDRDTFLKNAYYSTQTERISALLLISGISILYGNLNLYLIKRFPLSFMAMISSSSILIDSVLSYIVLGEDINPLIFPAILMLILGFKIYLSDISYTKQD